MERPVVERKPYKKKRQHCSKCSANYSKREYLAKHMINEHGIELEKKKPGRSPAYMPLEENDPHPYKCIDCMKEYAKSKHLSRHRRACHMVKMCSECNEPFLNYADHMLKSHGIDLPKNFQCEVCEKKFLTKAHIRSHMRIHNSKGRIFPCELCGKGFHFSTDLRKHMRTHSQKRSIICDICGDAFKSQDTLKCHMRRHTGEKPYQW